MAVNALEASNPIAQRMLSARFPLKGGDVLMLFSHSFAAQFVIRQAFSHT